ncbi:M20 family metallopeptidase [Streptomyces sp. NPDC059477]|uniref:M20 family metallopeptidase n=1 Tax=Streptomyces sp. NPDC059477 TaxID=3346847 RepID=UPI00368351F3
MADVPESTGRQQPAPGQDARTRRMVRRLAELVGCESPSGHRAGLESCYDLLEGWAPEGLGEARRVVRDGVPHLYWPGPGGSPRVLLLGHADTVWPLGTLTQRPFREDGDRLSGPGVFDMKAGLVIALEALALVGDLGGVGVLVTGDEETGSVTSRALLEEVARDASAVLVLEPSDDGAVKTARKGAAFYQVAFRGRAAHAGLEPERGANALIELAHQVIAMGELSDPAAGTTVTPTRARAGTAMNVVPDAAELWVDVRAWTAGELLRVEDRLKNLTARTPDVAVTVTGTVNRYPLEPERSASLLRVARAVAAARGLPEVGAVRVGGASDGNFTAALGVPTLDGLGPVGDGAHAVHEWVQAGSLVRRAELVAGIVEALGRPA